MLVLKVQSVCVGMEAVGESTAVALEVGQVTPSQLGNVCLRQYLSNRSLGKNAALVCAPMSHFVSFMSLWVITVKHCHVLVQRHYCLIMNQTPITNVHNLRIFYLGSEAFCNFSLKVSAAPARRNTLFASTKLICGDMLFTLSHI